MAMPTMTRAAKLKIENQRSRLNGFCTEEAAPRVSLIVVVPDAELIALPRRRTPVDRARSHQPADYTRSCPGAERHRTGGPHRGPRPRPPRVPASLPPARPRPPPAAAP